MSPFPRALAVASLAASLFAGAAEPPVDTEADPGAWFCTSWQDEMTDATLSAVRVNSLDTYETHASDEPRLAALMLARSGEGAWRAWLNYGEGLSGCMGRACAVSWRVGDSKAQSGQGEPAGVNKTLLPPALVKVILARPSRLRIQAPVFDRNARAVVHAFDLSELPTTSDACVALLTKQLKLPKKAD